MRAATGSRGVGGEEKLEEEDLFGGVTRKTNSREPNTEPKTSRAKHTIPPEFAVDDAMRAWAKGRVPLVDVDLETELFVRHFLDKPVKRPGWRRSWEAWMLRQQGWAKERQGRQPESGNRSAKRESTADRRVMDAVALAQRLAEEDRAS